MIQRSGGITIISMMSSVWGPELPGSASGYLPGVEGSSAGLLPFTVFISKANCPLVRQSAGWFRAEVNAAGS